MAIQVWRGGSTSPYLNKETAAVVVGRHVKSWNSPDALQLSFRIGASGGLSHVDVRVAPDSFAEIAEAMFACDPNAAIKAFGEALKGGVPALEPPSPSSASR